jgi:hypothetical protein
MEKNQNGFSKSKKKDGNIYLSIYNNERMQQ